MDDRVNRLLQKAEDALDRNDVDQADGYRILAGHVDYLRKREARELNKILKHTESP